MLTRSQRKQLGVSAEKLDDLRQEQEQRIPDPDPPRQASPFAYFGAMSSTRLHSYDGKQGIAFTTYWHDLERYFADKAANLPPKGDAACKPKRLQAMPPSG